MAPLGALIWMLSAAIAMAGGPVAARGAEPPRTPGEAALLKARIDSTLASNPEEPLAEHSGTRPGSRLRLPAAWSYGLRASLGASDFGGALGDSTTGALLGFDIGVYASRQFRFLAFEPQLVLAARGSNFTDPYYGTFVDPFGDTYAARIADLPGVLQMYYVETPMMGRATLGPWFFGPSVVGGVVPALLIAQRYSGNRLLRDFFGDSFRRTNVGWTLGVGTTWPTRHGMLTLDLRYEDGVGEAFKKGRGLAGVSRAWLLGCSIELLGPQSARPTSPSPPSPPPPARPAHARAD